MAYDDESSFFNFDDFTNQSLTERVTIERLLALTGVTHRVIAGRDVSSVPLPELAKGLRENGLGGIPFDTVARVSDHVSKIDAASDPLAHTTLRDVQRIIGK